MFPTIVSPELNVAVVDGSPGISLTTLSTSFELSI